MTTAAVAILAATLAAIMAAFVRRRAKPFPIREGAAGLAMLVAASALATAATLIFPAPAQAAGLNPPPEAKRGLDLLNQGYPQEALQAFAQLEKSAPDQPLGYLLEAEARWWQIYCTACEIKYNMIDAWKAPPDSSTDAAYFALTDKAVSLAEQGLQHGDSAEMEFYAGMGWMLRARLLALRDERRATATAGVKARAHLLRCLQLDPNISDAYTGLGLYNYYVDTLSAIARVLRVVMGIPGGTKQEGVRQLQIAMSKGVLTNVEARFYLAKNLRTYELDYNASAAALEPLVDRYPDNPFFRLLMGDVQVKAGHFDVAAANFHAAERIQVQNATCAGRIRALASEALALASVRPG